MLFTFYSYKGGVGRTMALANVAKWLAMQGLRVAMIDWDLEAPGLERFFLSDEKVKEVHNQLGLIDLLVSYRRLFPRLRDQLNEAADRDAKVKVLRKALPPITPTLHALHELGQTVPTGGALYLLSAGWRAGEKFPVYAHAVQAFDWDAFYRDFEGEAYFEWMREELLAKELADVVLVDSRTGVTEMGGVCTRQLADVVVTLCAPNLQNLDGVLSMASDLLRSDLAATRGRELRLVMVPSRVDNTNPVRVNEFMERFTTGSSGFTPQIFRTVKSSFAALRIPYAPTYAYQERLTIGESDADRDLEESYKRLAAHLAMLDGPARPLRVKLAREIERVFGQLLPTAMITCIDADRAMAADLRKRLENAKVPVWPDPRESYGASTDWARQLHATLQQTRDLIVIATPESLRSQELQEAWLLAREFGVRVLPLAEQPISMLLADAPAWMKQTQFGDLRGSFSDLVEQLTNPQPPTRVPRMAPQVPDLFVPRAEVLRRLGAQLRGEGQQGPGRRAALCGLPGSGKTSLAAEFSRSEALSLFPAGVVWVSAAEDADPKAEMEKVHQAVTGEQRPFADLREAYSVLERDLSGKPFLFVLDDAWSAETVGRYPLELRGCGYLVTTSDRSVAAAVEAEPIDVGALSEEEADALLRSLPTPPHGSELAALRGAARAHGAPPQTLRQAAASLRGGGTAQTGVPAVSATTAKAFEREVLGRLDEQDRQRLISLSFATGQAAMSLAEVRSLWQTTDCARTLERFGALSLLVNATAPEGIRVLPWARVLVADRFPQQDLSSVCEGSYGLLDDAAKECMRQVLCRLLAVTSTPDGMKVEAQPAPAALFREAQLAVASELEKRSIIARSSQQPLVYSLTDASGVQQWERLRAWIKRDQEFLVWRQRLAAYLADWHRTRDAGALLSGVLLEEGLRWAGARPDDLCDDELAFIERSRALLKERPAAAPGAPAEATWSNAARWSVWLGLALAIALAGAWVIMSKRSRAVEPSDTRDAGAPASAERTMRVLEGDLALKRRDATAAIAAYTTALALAGSDDAAIYFKRGSAYCGADEVGKCIADLNKSLALEPARALVLAARADAELQQGAVAAALGDLDAAIALDAKNAALYADRAAARERAGQHAGALEDYSASLSIDPAQSDNYFSRASIYEAQGDRERAVADLEKVVELNAEPNSVRAAQARLKRLGATKAAPVSSLRVYLHYLDRKDLPVLEELRGALEKRGFKVAGIELVKGARTTGDVRFLSLDATTGASIAALVEGTLADAGYYLRIGQLRLTTPSARPGRIEVWIPPLSLPPPRAPLPHSPE